MRKMILIIGMAMVTTCSFAQVKPKADTAKTAKPDTVKVAAADLKVLFVKLGAIINDSSDISTKQANQLNQSLNEMYIKYFPAIQQKPVIKKTSN